MITRRDMLKLGATAGAVLSLKPGILQALAPQELIMRAIPSSGEQVPIVGLGSSATFSSVARSEDFTALREVLRRSRNTADGCSTPPPATAHPRKWPDRSPRNWVSATRSSGPPSSTWPVAAEAPPIRGRRQGPGRAVVPAPPEAERSIASRSTTLATLPPSSGF